MVSALPSELSSASPAAVGAVLLAALTLGVLSSLEYVPDGRRAQLWVLGRKRGILEPGVNVVPPVVSATRSVPVGVQRREIDVEARTRDGTPVSAELTLAFEVEDVEQTLCVTRDYPEATEALAVRTVRNLIAALDSGSLLDDRDDFEERVALVLDPPLRAWGIRVESVDAGTPAIAVEREG